MPHPLHELIGDIASESIPPDCSLVRDPACGGQQCIPLFCSDVRSLATEFCNVDLLILRGGKIRVIVEIEESNVKPTQIAGKFLTSALATHFIHDAHGKGAILKDTRVLFIQVVDTKSLPVGSMKPKQWANIETSIRSILPVGGITDYRLFHGSIGTLLGDARRQLADGVSKACV